MCGPRGSQWLRDWPMAHAQAGGIDGRLDNRGRQARRGLSLYRDAADQTSGERMNSKAPTQLKAVPSGIKGLDDILQGGFFGGGLYIVEGPPGVGKTILGNQICFNRASSGKKVLYVTLIAETVARMLLNIKSLTFFKEDEVGNAIVYVSGFSALKEKGLNGLLQLLRKEVAARKATTLVVDGFASASDHARSH